MCILCDKGFRRTMLARTRAPRFPEDDAAGGPRGSGLFAARPAAAQDDDAPEDSGERSALHHSRRPRHDDGSHAGHPD